MVPLALSLSPIQDTTRRKGCASQSCWCSIPKSAPSVIEGRMPPTNEANGLSVAPKSGLHWGPGRAHLDWMRCLHAITAVSANRLVCVNDPSMGVTKCGPHDRMPNLPGFHTVKAR